MNGENENKNKAILFGGIGCLGIIIVIIIITSIIGGISAMHKRSEANQASAAKQSSLAISSSKAQNSRNAASSSQQALIDSVSQADSAKYNKEIQSLKHELKDRSTEKSKVDHKDVIHQK